MYDDFKFLFSSAQCVNDTARIYEYFHSHWFQIVCVHYWVFWIRLMFSLNICRNRPVFSMNREMMMRMLSRHILLLRCIDSATSNYNYPRVKMLLLGK